VGKGKRKDIVEAWELYETAERQITVPARGRAEIEWPLRGSGSGLEGSLWAVAKIMGAGELAYTAAARLDL